jgi:ribosomal protein S26
MDPSRDVYCLKCATIVPREQAVQVFKTGFYKITTPLAICLKCAHDESEKIHIKIDYVELNDVIYRDIQSVL